jgi:hypothetical protein
MLPSGIFNLPPRSTSGVKRTFDALESAIVSPPSKIQHTTPIAQPNTSSQVYSIPPRQDNPKVEPNNPTHLFKLPDRKKWDKKKIDTLARSSEVFEKTFGERLQEWIGDSFQVQPHENKFNRHDFYVFKKDNPQKKVWIELECGVTQDQWKQSVDDNRRRWVQGLNVVSRKIVEGKHFDVFIKHNTACNSFFASSYDFIKSQGKVQTQKSNSLKFKTDNTIYSLPWSLVDDKHPGLVVDDKTKLSELIQTFLV